MNPECLGAFDSLTTGVSVNSIFVWLHKDMDPVGIVVAAYFISQKEKCFLLYTKKYSDYYWEQNGSFCLFMSEFQSLGWSSL